MTRNPNYDQCLDRCEDRWPDEGGNLHELTQCWDRCDERFAGGKEPKAPAGNDYPPAGTRLDHIPQRVDNDGNVISNWDTTATITREHGRGDGE